MIGSIPNPKKTFVVDFPLAHVFETIQFIPLIDKDKKYRFNSKNDILKSLIFEALEFLSLGVYIDINLTEIAESKTQIDLEIRRKVGSFDKSHEVTAANNHISKFSNLISLSIGATEEQITQLRETQEKQPVQAPKQGCIVTLIVMIGGLMGIGSILYSCSKEEPEPNIIYIQSVTATPTNSENVVIKNNSGSSQDMTGWVIGDKNNQSAYSIPSGNIINNGSSLQFNASTMGFQINDSGETIYLKNVSGTVIDTWTN